MTTRQLLTETWQWSPSLLIGTLLLVGGYLYFSRFTVSRQSTYFFAGIVLMVLTLASPLTFLGERYLFSAHMVQHMILLLIVPPLLLAGIPERVFRSFLTKSKSTYWLSPALCWLLGVAIMWFWHVPGIYTTTLQDSGIPVCGLVTGPYGAFLHGIQNASLLFAGLLFAWPILSPVKAQRLPALPGMAYLFTACVGCSLLGLSITFSSSLLYPTYASTIDLTGAMHLVRRQWGISPASDQQIGGLMMWVPGCFIYVSAALFLLNRWFEEGEVLNDRMSAQS